MKEQKGGQRVGGTASPASSSQVQPGCAPWRIIGSLFIPFLAATLLYLNNRVPWPGPIRRNNIAANAVLVLMLLLFVIVSGLEIFLAGLRP